MPTHPHFRFLFVFIALIIKSKNITLLYKFLNTAILAELTDNLSQTLIRHTLKRPDEDYANLHRFLMEQILIAVQIIYEKRDETADNLYKGGTAHPLGHFLAVKPFLY